MYLGPALAAPPPASIRWKPAAAPAAALALNLDEVKIFINRPVEDTTWDDELTSFVKIAQRAIEAHCQMQLVASSWAGTAPAFYDRVLINRRPFFAVDALQYVDASTGTITTVPATTYHALPVGQDCGMIFLGDGQEWPDVATRYDAVRLTVSSGYGITDEQLEAGWPPLPDEIHQALLMTVASLDAIRGDSMAQASSNTTVYAMKQAGGGAGIIPKEAMGLLSPFKYRMIGVA